MLVGPAVVHPPPAAAQTGTPICAIQGTGSRSPLAGGAGGDVVTTRGVVAAAFLGSDVAPSERGFFLQDDGPVGQGCDGDDATSDGLFVAVRSEFAADLDALVVAGVAVTVTGSVGERYDLTRLELRSAAAISASVVSRRATPRAVPLDPPADPTDAAMYLEAREGMRVALPPSRVVAATNAHGVAYVLPSSLGVERLFRGVGDVRLRGLSAPGEWLALDHGADLPNIVGVLTHAFGEHRVLIGGGNPMPGAASRATPTAAPSSDPELLRVATYNLHDYFDAANQPQKGDPVRTDREYAHQTASRARSIAVHLGAPDVVGIQEAENEAVLDALANHQALAHAGYRAELIEETVGGLSIGRDARGIDVGFLYRAKRLRLVGVEQRPACATRSDALALLRSGGDRECADDTGAPGRWLFDRPPLVARFRVVGTQGRLTVINNHFRSMVGDDDTTPIRKAMAEHVRALADEARAADPAAAVVVLGDLNAFEDGPELAVLTAGGAWVGAHAGVPAAERYTYAFDGLHQVLDYILVPSDLPVAAARIAHANVDFASPSGLLGDIGSRVSDHDAVVVDVPVQALRHWVYLPVALAASPVVGAAPIATAARPTATAVPVGSPAEPYPTSRACGMPIVVPAPAGTPAPGEAPLRISALNYDGCVSMSEEDEYVEIENRSANDVPLHEWILFSDTGGQSFTFLRGDVVEAGGRCRVYTNQDHEATQPCAFSWSRGSAVWNNDGDTAILTGPNGAVADRVCYGRPEGGC